MDKLTFYSKQNKKPERTTRAEAHIWSFMTQWKTGYRCVREYVVRPYIADFAFPDLKVIIEADGGYHDGRVEYDNRRDAYLSSIGWTVIRFRNEAILEDTDQTIHEIVEQLDMVAKHMAIEPKQIKGRSPCGRIY